MPEYQNRRQKNIAASIVDCVENGSQKKTSLQKLRAFFYLNYLTYCQVHRDVFRDLRATLCIDPQAYRASFTPSSSSSSSSSSPTLIPMGDMGYSGSTFFRTSNSHYLIKSIPRRFEHTFFQHDLLNRYTTHLRSNPTTTLLTPITTFLEPAHLTLGTLLHLVPSHHIIMSNLLHGNDEAGGKWESFDLKPTSYFYPERDIASGALASEATKSKLADDFGGRSLLLTRDVAESLMGRLREDTAVLEGLNAVDYSLFVVRIPGGDVEDVVGEAGKEREDDWRVGVRSADGEWVYRAAVLDFFWAKHKTHARAMTALIKVYNLVDRKGPMSVTTTAKEYRERFLRMVEKLIEVRDEGGEEEDGRDRDTM